MTEQTEQWTAEDLQEFLELADPFDPLVRLWKVAALTGLSLDEICNLKWTDINLDAACMHTNGRRINIPPGAIQALQVERVRQNEGRFFSGLDYNNREFVFTKPNGDPHNPVWVEVHFDERVAECSNKQVEFSEIARLYTEMFPEGEGW